MPRALALGPAVGWAPWWNLSPKHLRPSLLPGALFTFISEATWLQTGSGPLPRWLLGIARTHATVIGWTADCGAWRLSMPF